MVLDFKQYFFNPICINCGSFFVENHLYCDFCFKTKIENYLAVHQQTIDEKHSHVYLIDWVPGESDLISEMVYRFKADRCLKAWEFYVKLFADALIEDFDLSDYHALVPLPGSSQSSVHALIFAKLLSHIWGLPVLNALSKAPTAQAQKLKSGIERRDQDAVSDICRLEQFTKEDVGNLNLIYVDDIMTTGATYRRSQEALGNTNKSLLITLFYRPKPI